MIAKVGQEVPVLDETLGQPGTLGRQRVLRTFVWRVEERSGWATAPPGCTMRGLCQVGHRRTSAYRDTLRSDDSRVWCIWSTIWS